MTLVLEEPRVLVCGNRLWPWSATVQAVQERLLARHGESLVVIEGAATAADQAAHTWCERHDFGPGRQRCHPVDWQAERRERPGQWRMAGPERPPGCCLRRTRGWSSPSTIARPPTGSIHRPPSRSGRFRRLRDDRTYPGEGLVMRGCLGAG